jgi:hypothetical protein
MAEYVTEEEARQRSGMAFFERDGRLGRVQALVEGMSARTFRDEVWVSALDEGADLVRDGRIFGLRVVVSSFVLPGVVMVWSYSEGEFRE